LSRYFQRWQGDLYSLAVSHVWTVQPLTCALMPPRLEIYLPSRGAFEKTAPDSSPAGLIFPGGSFLVAHELVTFDYRDAAAREPTLHRLAYSYHYQRPDDGYYFRYDHHPDVGDPDTHPLHHLHAAGWRPDDVQLYEGVRHPVNEISFGEVLRLIRLRFPEGDF
jgi:hypothetical protein